jgi:hypothetical protein
MQSVPIKVLNLISGIDTDDSTKITLVGRVIDGARYGRRVTMSLSQKDLYSWDSLVAAVERESAGHYTPTKPNPREARNLFPDLDSLLESSGVGADPSEDKAGNFAAKPCRLLNVTIQGGLRDNFQSTQKPNWVAVVVLVPSGRKRVLPIEDVTDWQSLDRELTAQGFSCERPDPSASVLDLPDSLIRSLTGGNYPSPGNSPKIQTMSPQQINDWFCQKASVDGLLYQVKPTQEARASAGAALFSDQDDDWLAKSKRQYRWDGKKLVRRDVDFGDADRVRALLVSQAESQKRETEAEIVSAERQKYLLNLTNLGRAVLASA